MTRRKARTVTYQIVTATKAYQCVICVNRIQPGERYSRRRRQYAGNGYVTIAKCSQCQPIPEGAE